MKPVGHPRYGFRRKRGKEPYLPSIGVEGGVEISLKVELEGYLVRLLVDTGAQISVLKNPIPGIALEPSRLKARGVTGQSLTVLGEQELLCNLKGTKVRHRFTVAPIDTDHEGLIGLDLLKKLSAIVNVASGTVEISTRATERACFKVKNLIERERQTMVAQIDLLAKKYAPSWLKQPERSPKRRGKTRPRSNPGPAEEVAPGEDINEVEDNFTSSDDSGDEPPMWYRAGESSDEEIDVEYEPPLSQKEPNLEEQEAFEEDRGGTSPAQRESEESHSLVQDFTEDPKDLTWVPEEQEPPNIRSPYQLRRRVPK